MNQFTIRNGVLEDLPRIMEIYGIARKFMAENGNPNQWGPTNWPPEELIRDDIAKEKCYVCELAADDGGVGASAIVGVFYFNAGRNIEPTYAEIEGSWKGDDNYGVVHRIATDGVTRGVGSTCVDWAFGQCGHLRIDTHSDNKVMQNMLRKLGFQECGIIYVVEDNYPRIAFEKF